MERCKHLMGWRLDDGLLIDTCSLCGIRKYHNMLDVGERRRFNEESQKWESYYVSEDYETWEKAKTHERDLHAHWTYGEAVIGQMEHISQLRPLDRLTLELTRPGNERVNRFEPAVGENRPRTDRLEDLAPWIDLDIPNTLPILESFRVLDLPDRTRSQLTFQIRANRPFAQEVLSCAQEVSKEILPPMPVLLAEEPTTDDEEEMEVCERSFEDPIDTYEQSLFNSIPVGEHDGIGQDYLSSARRTQDFRRILKAIKQAKDSSDGRALAPIGRKDSKTSIHNANLRGRESGVLWHLYKVAKDRIHHNHRNKLELAVQTIISGATGKAIYNLTKGGGLGKIKLSPTTEETSLFWAVYKATTPAPSDMGPEPPPPSECPW